MDTKTTGKASTEQADPTEVERLRAENERLRAELERARQAAARSSRPLEALWADIEHRLGVCPSFFKLAAGNPAVAENLWRQAEFTYLDSPMPSLFKERLFTYVSRFCEVPYCISRHCAFLMGRGRPAGDPEAETLTAKEALALLSKPAPTTAELKRHLDLLFEIQRPLEAWPEPDSKLEQAIFRCTVAVFLEPVPRERILLGLRRVLGPERFHWLMLFLAFIRTAHFWTEVHPSLTLEEDADRLLEEHQALAEWLDTYPDMVQAELRERVKEEHRQLEATRERVSALEQTNEELRATKEALKEHQQALQSRNQLLEGLFEHAPAGLALFDAEPPYEVLMHNEVYQKFWPEPFRSEGLVGKCIPDYAPRAEESGIFDVFREVARTGEGKTIYEFPYDGLSRGRTWWNWNLSPIFVEGELVAFAHMLIEMTEEVKARQRLKNELKERTELEKALRERKERLRLALSAGDMGIWDLDLQTGKALIDTQEARLLGLSPEEQHIALETFFNLIHPEDRPRKKEFFERGKSYDAEFRVVRPDGETRWLASTTTFVRNEEDEPIRALGVNFDITERKEAEEALKEAKEAAEAANRAKSEFLANMSHEIRTPLTSIIGFTSVLSQKASDEAQQYIQRIERNGERLLDTLNSILTLARLEAESIEVDFEAVAIAEEVERVAALYAPKARKKGLHFRHEVAPGAEKARTLLDTGALNSILQNLLSNAVKFTDEGSITVETRLAQKGSAGTEEAATGGTAPQVQMRVADTGCGIEEAFLEKIFESFEQESKGLSRRHEGSGLGLAITRQLVELLGGEIEVESQKDQGSVFTVTFPLAEGEEHRPSAAEGEGPEAAPEVPEEEEVRLLAVEDHADTRSLLQNLLEEVGQAEVVGTAEEALREARLARFDVVLVDINLGSEESGIDLLRKLRRLPSYEEVPVVALTAYALPGDRERFLEEGFDAYLGKPFKADKLQALLREHLPQ